MSKKTTLRVVSYNIQMLTWMRKSYDLFEKFIIQYDIIFIQEAFENVLIWHGRRKIISLLVKNGYHVKYDKRSLRYLVSSGLIVASRYPLTQFKFKAFDTHEGPDRFARKGVLTCVTRTPYGDITLVNTHLQSAYTQDEFPYTGSHKKIRLEQLKIFNEILKNIKDPDMCVIGGDFNTDDNIEKNILSCIFLDNGLTFSIINGFDSVACNIPLFGDKAKAKKDNSYKIIKDWSDHNPITMEISF